MKRVKICSRWSKLRSRKLKKLQRHLLTKVLAIWGLNLYCLNSLCKNFKIHAPTISKRCLVTHHIYSSVLLQTAVSQLFQDWAWLIVVKILLRVCRSARQGRVHHSANLSENHLNHLQRGPYNESTQILEIIDLTKLIMLTLQLSYLKRKKLLQKRPIQLVGKQTKNLHVWIRKIRGQQLNSLIRQEEWFQISWRKSN